LSYTVNAITDKNVSKIRHRSAIFCNNRQNSFARFLFILCSRHSFANFNFLREFVLKSYMSSNLRLNCVMVSSNVGSQRDIGSARDS